MLRTHSAVCTILHPVASSAKWIVARLQTFKYIFCLKITLVELKAVRWLTAIGGNRNFSGIAATIVSDASTEIFMPDLFLISTSKVLDNHQFSQQLSIGGSRKIFEKSRNILTFLH